MGFRKKEDQREEIVVALRGGPGQVERLNLLEKDETNGRLNLAGILTLQPGCGIGPHPHGEDGEFFYVLEGELTGQEHGESVILRPGDATFTSDGEVHSLFNHTDSPSRVLALILHG
jgi:quercetin dioxygenase-like cupin family protein